MDRQYGKVITIDGENNHDEEKPRHRIIRAIILISLLALTGFLIRPAIQLGKAISHDNKARDGLPPGHIDDASRLNETRISKVWPIPVNTEDAEAQLTAPTIRVTV